MGIRLVGLNAPQSLLHLINAVRNIFQIAGGSAWALRTAPATLWNKGHPGHVSLCCVFFVGYLCCASARVKSFSGCLGCLPSAFTSAPYSLIAAVVVSEKVAISTPPPSSTRAYIRPPNSMYPYLSQVGIAGLPQRLQEILPEMDLDNKAHRKRFEDAISGFSHGAGIDAAAMNRMYEAQTLWDEYMAESASR